MPKKPNFGRVIKSPKISEFNNFGDQISVLIDILLFKKNTIYSHIKLPIMFQTGPSQIGHKNKGESFNLADKIDSQVSKINTDLI